MAKVFADDISLDFTTSVPFVVYYSSGVIDTTGNDNGHLDPGETVDLITTLKNFGVSATNVEGLLLTDDPYITIHDSISVFGDIAPGDTANNEADPYYIEAASIAPTGHIADFTLIANSTGGYSDTSYFSLCIGKHHYFVWDPTPDQSSGPVIDATLKSLGYSGNFSQALPVIELDRYMAVFVSCGIYSSNYIIQNGSAETNALVNFLNSGGRMYLEGGDVWYWDPLYGGYDFGPLFGINPTADGSGNLVTVNGQSGTFTEGMSFSYTGENSYIDHISAISPAFLIFRNSSPVYDCGVAYDAGTYKTFGTSFEFAGLVNGSPPSTKETLADTIMHFFGLYVGVEDKPATDFNLPKVCALFQNYPNPFSKETTFKYSIPKASYVNVSLFDVSGRCIKRLVNERQRPGYYTLRLDGSELNTGIYFVRLQSDNFSLSRKCIIVR